ncbi:hypothetical protein [Streptococcus fryi]
MKKVLFSIVTCLCILFISGCSNTDLNLNQNLGLTKHEAEVEFIISENTKYHLLEGLNTSTFTWSVSGEGEKPELKVLFNIIEPEGISDEESQTFYNRYSSGQYMQELNANIISAKFENEKQLYDVKHGDVLKVVTTMKKSKKYNFDYFTKAKGNKDIEVKDAGDNILVISKIVVDYPFIDDEDDNIKTLSEFEAKQFKFISGLFDEVWDFKIEELSLTKDYPMEVEPLFFVSHSYKSNNGGPIRQQAEVSTPSQLYASILTGPDEGSLTEEKIEAIKTEGIEKYQEELDFNFAKVVTDFQIITSDTK